MFLTLQKKQTSHKVSVHCHLIFTCVRMQLYASKWNKGNVRMVARKRKSWTSLNFNVYARPHVKNNATVEIYA